MTDNARNAHNAFSFSLAAARSLNGYALVPAIDGARLNRELDARIVAPDKPGLIAQIEDFLARYFAIGCEGAG